MSELRESGPEPGPVEERKGHDILMLVLILILLAVVLLAVLSDVWLNLFRVDETTETEPSGRVIVPISRTLPH